MKTVTTLVFFACASFASVVASEAPRFNVDARAVTAIENGGVVSYADVLERATPSVVAVYTSRMQRPAARHLPPGMEELFRNFGMPMPRAPEQDEPQQRERLQRVGVGSGVIVSEDGYIVTNHHVIQVRRGQAADEIRVRLGDGREYVAELVGSDRKTDVAVLKIEATEPLPAMTIADSSLLRVGDVVFAIGNPLDVGLTATQGIVSATGRDSFGILGPGAYENFIQTDAAVNLGNSGGALIDARGRLIGINTAIVSGTGGNIGIGFAIPVNMALNVMTNLIQTGEVPRGLLGLVPANLTRDMVDAFGLESTRGALVNQVQPGSPAEEAGIRHGDVILAVDDIRIESAPQLRLVVSQMAPGSEVDVRLVRRGEELVVSVVLGSLTGAMAMTQEEETPVQDILEGVHFERISDEIRQEHSIPEEIDGVFVREVSFESDFADHLTKGMVILEVNDTAVRTPAELQENLRPGLNRLYVWSGGQHAFLVIRLN